MILAQFSLKHSKSDIWYSKCWGSTLVYTYFDANVGKNNLEVQKVGGTSPPVIPLFCTSPYTTWIFLVDTCSLSTAPHFSGFYCNGRPECSSSIKAFRKPNANTSHLYSKWQWSAFSNKWSDWGPPCWRVKTTGVTSLFYSLKPNANLGLPCVVLVIAVLLYKISHGFIPLVCVCCSSNQGQSLHRWQIGMRTYTRSSLSHWLEIFGTKFVQPNRRLLTF